MTSSWSTRFWARPDSGQTRGPVEFLRSPCDRGRPTTAPRGDELEPFKIGDVIAGKYEITGVLGQGGMGVVVAAHQRELGRLVALKFLRPSLTEKPESYARFAREARTATRINDPARRPRVRRRKNRRRRSVHRHGAPDGGRSRARPQAPGSASSGRGRRSAPPSVRGDRGRPQPRDSCTATSSRRTSS